MSGQETKAIQLEDRYDREEGTVYLSGLQALVRLPIDQARRDRRAGLRIGTFISGYPGSPLGTYDLAIQQAGDIIPEHGIVHVPAANEELAATAISGTQMLDTYPHSRYDGVTALWYGKGPGIDRAGDALKHGNFAGTSEHGAVVVLAGEDHEAKSSTMPFQDDYAFMSAGMPILYPASTGEFLELGHHAVHLSRFSGCWVGFKLVGQLCDGGETVRVSPDSPEIVIPEFQVGGKPFRKRTDFKFFPGTNLDTERRLYYERHAAARAYARANRLDRVILSTPADRVGIVTAGKSYADVRQALLDMRIQDNDLRRFGVRLLRMGLVYPIDQDIVREFARDLDELIVIEEKRGFLESQVKEALCGLGRPIRVVGKLDEAGAPLFPIQGGMDSDTVAERLGPRLLHHTGGAHAGILGRLAELRAVRSRPFELLPSRTPNYCSGCPHNISTKLHEGELAWGSPGCHSFASIMTQPERQIVSMTQYGGEGLPWIGLAPFTDREHLVQNVGDGSLFHSSYLNVRFAVAVGANMTFKILYNGSIANTGAQVPTGAKSVADLTRLLSIEGVKKIAVITKNPGAYRRQQLGAAAVVYPVHQSERAMRDLEQTHGTTVYLYDGMCANERRRQQKRGKLPIPNEFVVINQDVCENCGHCGALTNCMSLHKVPTELGEKTQIHTSSCNLDYSCLGGDCPSFLTVQTKDGTGYRKPRPPQLEAVALPEPATRPAVGQPYHVYIPGVGGTGVITINALLCYAALMDGKRVLSYDQTGAAQKWGPVLSSLVIADAEGREGNGEDHRAVWANKVGIGKADLYLAFDVMAGASRANLDRCDPTRTAALVNTSLLPSGEMVRDVNYAAPVEPMRDRIAEYTDPARTVYVAARQHAEALFGDYMTANMFALGTAYQAGLLPLTSESIEAAIRLNGVQVEQNLQAFRYGRLEIVDPARIRALAEPPRSTFQRERALALARLRGPSRQAYLALLGRCDHLDEESRRLLAVRIAELIEYQHPAYPEVYVEAVLDIAARDRAMPGEPALTHAVIRNLYKLLAYKDEYEVARLHLKAARREQTRDLFTEPRTVSYQFHPPLLRAIGLKRKVKLGPWFDPALRVMRDLRGLRGTPLDPFGRAHVRQVERSLVTWYRDLLALTLDHLSPATYPTAVEIAELPDDIRGYEEIKLRNVDATKQRAEELVRRLTEPSPSEVAMTVGT